MANEITVRNSLNVRMRSKDYASRPMEFRVSATNPRGPEPGLITATTAGVDIVFSELANPTYCRIANNDTTNFIEYGVWDGATFHPLGEVLPSEFYVLRLSRNLTTLRIRADTADCDVIIEAFEDATTTTTTTTPAP